MRYRDGWLHVATDAPPDAAAAGSAGGGRRVRNAGGDTDF